MQLLRILGTGVGWEHRIKVCLACRAMTLPCHAAWLSPLHKAGLAKASSPAMLVEMGALFGARILEYKIIDFKRWRNFGGATTTPANMINIYMPCSAKLHSHIPSPPARAHPLPPPARAAFLS